jgi:hypothetical protein
MKTSRLRVQYPPAATLLQANSVGLRVILPLNGGARQRYKHVMRAMDEFGRKGLPRAIPAEGLPRAIPAEELEIMLGTSAAFCSWDASHSTVSELMDSWPFLFSQPLTDTN